jgi:predicted dehydrogenase/threonine dehydrogenase-like Zn-dependent dehydrogenase
MKAVTKQNRTGIVEVVDVPSPELQPGGVLVRTHFSAISSGTEIATLKIGERSLLGKAQARPDLVRQVMNVAKAEGVKTAYAKVMSRLESMEPLGYSCSGTVLSVAPGVSEFHQGNRVACAGAEFAHHSQINFVPKNLVVHVPPSVSLEASSLTTIGAIAVQGLRQGQIAFGETVAVIGAGLIGLLVIQLARAAGCRVIALDLDPARLEFAATMGAHLTIDARDERAADILCRFAGYGADSAIITASSPSADPLQLATTLLRDRGRIVVIGDVGMGVPRRDLYDKELSVFLSRSYGPGRYDPLYEEQGVDYPIGYVRWTERRNMEAFLQMIESGSVNVSPLLSLRFPLDQAEKAYATLRETGAYTVILQYPDSEPTVVAQAHEGSSRLGTKRKPGVLTVSCIGAGSFAKDVILPHLATANGVRLLSVGTRSGVSAEHIRRRFSFERADQPSDIFGSTDTDTIFVLSRHDTHARYVISALTNGKSVYVEKPLATTPLELEEIVAVVNAQSSEARRPSLMVGFNRRFAPASQAIQTFFADRREPMVVHMRVNAGYLEPDHWTHGDGGRIAGEVCHFVDWARFIVGSPIVKVFASALPDGSRYQQDNLVATLHFRDGSLANLIYVANGDRKVPKEYFEVFCEGSIARLDDFQHLSLTRAGRTVERKSKRDKGHRRELDLTLTALREGSDAPIPFGELVEVTSATFAIRQSIECGTAIQVKDLDGSAAIK